MNKPRIFTALLTIFLGIIVMIGVVKLVLKNEGFNEGKFRINDAIITSTAELTDKTVENGKWSLNISQKNILTFLVSMAEDTNIKRVYLSDLKVKGNNEIVFYLKDSENRIQLNRKKQDLDIEYVINDNKTMLLEFVALNENIIKNWIIPEELKEIICDGRIFKTARLNLDDLEYVLSFKLNIIEESGKQNVLKVKLELPKEELIVSGADVRRLDIKEFKFKVK